MKYINFIFFCCMAFQLSYAQPYINSLDSLIDEKISSLGHFSNKVKNTVDAIQAITQKKPSLQNIDDFLARGYLVDLSYLDKLYQEDDSDIKIILQDLKNYLYVKLYQYYLVCAEQKLLDLALKNYDTSSYWHNEKFKKNKYFSDKNILRWFSISKDRIHIENRIALLQIMSKETHTFLGLLRYNQHCLRQAQTQEDFEKNLSEAISLQDDFFDNYIKNKDINAVEDIIKKSTTQVYNFSHNILQQYTDVDVPSYTERYWQSYAALAAVMCVSGFFYNKYGIKLTQGPQYFWEHHVSRPFEQFQNMLSGLTHIPTLGNAPQFEQVSLDEDKKILEELIDVGARIPQVNGQLVPLDQANAELLHEATGGEFVKQYKYVLDIVDNIKESIENLEPIIEKINSSLDKSQPILDKVNHSLDKIQPILNHELQQYEKFKKIVPILKEHLMVFEHKLHACKEQVQREVDPNDWTNNYIAKQVVTTDELVGAKLYLKSADVVTELVNNVIKTFDTSGLMDGFNGQLYEKDLTTIINSEDFKIEVATQELKKIQKNLHQFSSSNYQQLDPVDISNWTFEQKKQRAFDNDRIILAHPEKNIKNLPGAYHRVAIRQLVDSKEQVNKFIDQTNYQLDGIYTKTNNFVKEIYTDNSFMLGVIGFIPVATVCAGSLFALDKLYSSFVYRPIRQIMYHIEVLLNESLYASTCFERDGYLYFLTEQLKLHVGVLTFAEQQLIEDDITLLRSANLDYMQKFNTVQRMYRTYQCLATRII